MKYIVVEYFYSKTNQMHNISKLFYLGTTLYILDFKLSPCSECCMLSYGELPRRKHTTTLYKFRTDFPYETCSKMKQI